jgi:thioredoxin 1
MCLTDLLVRAQINGAKPVLIDFEAEWCGVLCRLMQPILEQLSEKSRGVAFYRMDIDQVPGISQEVGINGVCGARLLEMSTEG